MSVVEKSDKEVMGDVLDICITCIQKLEAEVEDLKHRVMKLEADSVLNKLRKE